MVNNVIRDNSGWVSNFSDSLRFKVDNNNPPSVSIVEITTEQSDSVRIIYVLRDDEGDTLRIRLGIARALLKVDETYRKILRQYGLLK